MFSKQKQICRLLCCVVVLVSNHHLLLYGKTREVIIVYEAVEDVDVLEKREIPTFTSEQWYRSFVLRQEYELKEDEQLVIVSADGWKGRYAWINWYETQITESLFLYLVLHSSIYKEDRAVFIPSPF